MSTHFPPKPQFLRYVDASSEASTSEVESARPVYIADLPSSGGGGVPAGSAETWIHSVAGFPGDNNHITVSVSAAPGQANETRSDIILLAQIRRVKFEDISDLLGAPAMGYIGTLDETWPEWLSVDQQFSAVEIKYTDAELNPATLSCYVTLSINTNGTQTNTRDFMVGILPPSQTDNADFVSALDTRQTFDL